MTESKTIEITVEEPSLQLRIDAYLANHTDLQLTRNRVQQLIESDSITVNGKPINKKYKVQYQDQIIINIPATEPSLLTAEKIDLNIIYQDDYLVVINKPAGMVTHPGAGNRSGTLVNALIYHFRELSQVSGSDRPGIVHRLDKDTSGLLVIARDDRTYQYLQQAIQKREIKRGYLALVCGHMKEQQGIIDLPIGRSIKDRKKMSVTSVSARNAVTKYRLVKRYRTYDLFDISLLTGRTHQIRVHFSHLGHPVLGDPQYGGREKWHRGIFAPERPLAKKILGILNRQALHAQKLELVHPVSGEKLIFEAPLPNDYKKVLELLDAEGN